jgi:hypothetical protein
MAILFVMGSGAGGWQVGGSGFPICYFTISYFPITEQRYKHFSTMQHIIPFILK